MMTQGRLAIRRWLVVVVACLIVLGLGAVFVNRAVTVNHDEVAPAAPEATPRVAEPAATSSPTAIAPSVVPIPAEAAAREASWREAREAAIRVQQRLRAEQQARKSAEGEEVNNERCIGDQRMRRVENGWVQAGNC